MVLDIVFFEKPSSVLVIVNAVLYSSQVFTEKVLEVLKAWL